MARFVGPVSMGFLLLGITRTPSCLLRRSSVGCAKRELARSRNIRARGLLLSSPFPLTPTSPALQQQPGRRVFSPSSLLRNLCFRVRSQDDDITTDDGKLSNVVRDLRTDSAQHIWDQQEINIEGEEGDDIKDAPLSSSPSPFPPSSSRNLIPVIYQSFPHLRFIRVGLLHIEITCGAKHGSLSLSSSASSSSSTPPPQTPYVTLAIKNGRVMSGSNVASLSLLSQDRSRSFCLRATLHGEKYPTRNKGEDGKHNVNYHRADAGGNADERRTLLDSALEQYGVDPRELNDDDGKVASSSLGNPAIKAYMSFIYPKPNTAMHVHSLKKHAQLIAAQVMMLNREHNARQAEYLRNIDNAQRQVTKRHELVVVLDNVRSAFNVGQIFRTAEAAALQEVVTCGITPHPPHPQINKTALGAEEYVPTRHFTSTKKALEYLRSQGYYIIGMETTARSGVYSKVNYPQPTALIVGNEVSGICTEVMDKCDELVEIPCFGVKNSLNVAAAVATNVFEVVRQWNDKVADDS